MNLTFPTADFQLEDELFELLEAKLSYSQESLICRDYNLEKEVSWPQAQGRIRNFSSQDELFLTFFYAEPINYRFGQCAGTGPLLAVEVGSGVAGLARVIYTGREIGPLVPLFTNQGGRIRKGFELFAPSEAGWIIQDFIQNNTLPKGCSLIPVRGFETPAGHKTL